VLYVASTGGHLEQLARLAARFRPEAAEEEWVTFDTPQSRGLLRGRTVHFVPEVAPKDVRGATRMFPTARDLLRRRPFTRVVSTGAAIAVPFAIAARAAGVRFHYVESSARSAGPSLSGRLVARVPGSRLYTQYPAWEDARWKFRGAVFDSHVAAPEPVEVPAGGLRRVVVTLGTQRGFDFRRAVERLVTVLPKVTTPDAEVLWQTGWTDVSGLGVDGVQLVPPAVMRDAVADADLVVAHAGVGSALLAVEAGRCPVLLPRHVAYGEHTDDHQAQIAGELHRRGLAVMAEADAVTPEDLLQAAAMRAVPASAPAPFPLQTD
jgi:UDP-N-acetylglucosamine transferase subunit ALG13